MTKPQVSEVDRASWGSAGPTSWRSTPRSDQAALGWPPLHEGSPARHARILRTDMPARGGAGRGTPRGRGWREVSLGCRPQDVRYGALAGLLIGVIRQRNVQPPATVVRMPVEGADVIASSSPDGRIIRLGSQAVQMLGDLFLSHRLLLALHTPIIGDRPSIVNRNRPATADSRIETCA